MRFFKKLGIFSFEDFMYAGSTFVLAMYVICILVITLFQIAGQSVIFSSRFSLCSLDIQFPFFLIICIVLMYLSMFIWIFMGFASIFYRKKVDLEQEDDSTLISVLIPAHNEEDVIEGILGDLVAQEYKNLEIIVLAHNCTDFTISRAQSVNDSRIRVLDVKTRKSGKALALNRGLEEVKGEIIAQFDTDNRIKDKKLFNRAIVYFRDGTVDAIQAELSTSNKFASLLTFLQEVEYDTFSSISWRGRDVLGLPCFLAGTGIFIRTKTLREMGRWQNSLVEDFEIPHPDDQFDTDPSDGTEQWFYYSINVPTELDSSYQNKVCHFKFVFNGWQTNLPDPSQGFTDTEEITNMIALTDWTGPIISNVEGLIATPGESNELKAIITWETDEFATSNVDWGIDTSYGNIAPNTEDTTVDNTSHFVEIPGLTENTTYHFRVRSKDAFGNESISGDYTFETNGSRLGLGWSDMVINEFLLDPLGDDSASMPDGEWVELYNKGTNDMDVSGWYLTNSSFEKVYINNSNTHTGGTIVSAKGFLVVYLNGQYTDWLNNDTDIVSLFASKWWPLIDSHTYNKWLGDIVLENKSFARIPDGSNTWYDPIPTPGMPNELSEEEKIELGLLSIEEQIATTTTTIIPDSIPNIGTTTISTTTFDFASNTSTSTTMTTIFEETTTTTSTIPDIDILENSTSTITTIPEEIIPEQTTVTTTEPLVAGAATSTTTMITTEPPAEESDVTTTTTEPPIEETTTTTTTMPEEPITTTTTIPEIPTTTTTIPEETITTTTTTEPPIIEESTTTTTIPEPPVSTDAEIDDLTGINLINIYFV